VLDGIPNAEWDTLAFFQGALWRWALLHALRADVAKNLLSDIKDRASVAEWRRKTMQELTGADDSILSGAELLDSIQYFVFPNFCPWDGEGPPLTYQFRPNADSPGIFYFDIWMLIRSPDEGEPPPSPKIIKPGPDQHFEPQIGDLGKIVCCRKSQTCTPVPLNICCIAYDRHIYYANHKSEG
jgi:hypothetical protein